MHAFLHPAGVAKKGDIMFARRVTVLALAFGLGATAANAVSLRDVAGPAELPPASYSSDRYVDSKGCVFVRAGYGANTVWVPQVTRDRKLLCGQTPSLRAAAAPAKPAPKPVAVRAAPPAKVAAPRTRVRSGVPAGFKPAWTDGRLNPNRGPRTARGDAEMALVWTNTVPRRLVSE